MRIPPCSLANRSLSSRFADLDTSQWGFRGSTFFGVPYDPSGKVRSRAVFHQLFPPPITQFSNSDRVFPSLFNPYVLFLLSLARFTLLVSTVPRTLPLYGRWSLGDDL